MRAGKLIDLNLNKFSSIPQFKQLRSTHASFHKCAASLVERIDSGEDISSELTLGAKTDYAQY